MEFEGDHIHIYIYIYIYLFFFFFFLNNVGEYGVANVGVNTPESC